MYNSKKPNSTNAWKVSWHDGHTALFKKAMNETGQVVIMIRDMEVNESNPMQADKLFQEYKNTYPKEGYAFKHDYDIISVPNIVDIRYGRDVGYTFTKHDLGEEIHKISATEIRKGYTKE